MARMTAAAVIVSLGLTAGACGPSQPQEAPATTGAEQPRPPGTPEATGDLDITFTSEPDPPVTGDNTFEVTVRQPDGTPVTDAAVTADFFMPAMPEMKMPEMRTSTTLAHEGDGRYRGRGQVTMAGPWEVTVTVARGGEAIGTRRLDVTAR